MPGESNRRAALERERSYRLLRNSKLTIFDEYRRMLRDIHEHLEEEKRLPHGRRKKKENDMRPFLYDTEDTYEVPFFSVLIKMLLEILSMKNAQKQLEDLQRVYQWYFTYRTQLCKAKKNFGQSQNMSKPLTYRPSSSVEAGSRSGILRHVKSSKENLRTDRPRTSHVSLERSKASSPHITHDDEEDIEHSFLNIKSVKGVMPPFFPHDLADCATSPVPMEKTARRPEIPSSRVVIDHVAKTEKSLAKSKVEEPMQNEVMQLPISKVSIRYNSPEEHRKAGRVHHCEQNSEKVHLNEALPRSNVDSLRQRKHIKDESALFDYQSVTDEDRVIVDADQFIGKAIFEGFENSGCENKSAKDVSETASETEYIFGKSVSYISDEELLTLSKEEQVNMQSENGTSSNTVEKQQKLEYITSYSKFQKLKERKKAGYNDSPEAGNSWKAVSSTTHHTVAKKQTDRPSGLTKQGLTTNAVLEMVTPIGQQMLEQRGPMQVVSEFRKEVKPSPSNSPHSSPRDRLSPRLHLRSNTGLKTELENQKLKKAELYFSEESPRMYKVHFPQEKPIKPEKHYKISGPVEPDSVRYQYTNDGFGSKTYIKKLTRPHNYSRNDSVKTRYQYMSPHAVYQNKDPRTMNTKALASSMIIKHLGASDRRSSDRMTGHSNAFPVWVASQDTENIDTTNYVKFNKPLERDAAFSSAFSETRRPMYNVRQIAVELPESTHNLVSNSGDKGRYLDREHGIYPQSSMPVYHVTNDSMHGDEIDGRRVEWMNQYNDGYFPLKAEGHALQVGEKSPHVPKKTTTMNATQCQITTPNPSRPVSRQTERSKAASPMQNLSRPVSACSHSSSRLGSTHSKKSSRPRSARSASKPKELVQGSFDVRDFSHYCFDDNPHLDDDYQLQRKTNAAVDIQRIFRGYMARKYARDLKLIEKERQKRAAIMIQSSMRGYLARKRLMEERLSQRPPQINVDEWERQYKGYLKKRGDARAMKAQARSREFAKLQVKQEERVKQVNASKAIYDIFHDKGPTKAQMKAAAITIQRYVRGWLVRRFYQKAKQKAMKRTLDFNGFINSYKAHLERIMERHGVEDPKAFLAFNELLEYIESRNKYEVEYDRIANGKSKGHDRVFTYEDIKKFFEACGHFPSRREIEDSIAISLQDVVEMKQHNYTKAQIVEIAFQIYVPKGTKLSSTRKSTWLNPIVDGDEAAMIKLSKKINEETKLEKVFEFMSAVKREKVEMEQRAITPDLLPLDAKLNGFEKLNDKPVMKGPQRKKKT